MSSHSDEDDDVSSSVGLFGVPQLTPRSGSSGSGGGRATPRARAGAASSASPYTPSPAAPAASAGRFLAPQSTGSVTLALPSGGNVRVGSGGVGSGGSGGGGAARVSPERVTPISADALFAGAQKSARAPTAHDVLVAATYVEAAHEGYRLMQRSTPRAVRWYRFFLHGRVRQVVGLLLAVYLVLAIFEFPAYIAVPYPAIEIVSLCLASVLLTVAALEQWLYGFERSVDGAFDVARLLALVIMFVSAIAAFFTLWANLANQLLRPFVLIWFSRGLLRNQINLFRTVRGVVIPWILIWFVVVFYALVGMVVFADTREGEIWFSDLQTAIFSMFVLLTTANNPDVRMPAFRGNIASGLFFVTYLVIALIFLYNMLIAVIYSSFRRANKESTRSVFEVQTVSFFLAFRRLDVNDDGRIRMATVHEMLALIYRKPTSKVPIEILSELPVKEAGWFNQEEFQGMCELLAFEIFRLPSPSCFSVRTPRLHRAVKRITRHRAFEVIVQLLVFSNAVVAAVQIALSVERGASIPLSTSLDGWFWANTGFLMLYYVEMILRVIANGFRRTFFNAWFLFDLAIGVLMTTSTALFASYAASGTTSAYGMWTFVLMSRIVRLLRLLSTVPFLKRLLLVFWQIAPGLATFLITVVSFMYVFAVVGTHWFVGLLQPTNPALLGSAYDTADYYANNFDNIVHAFFVLWDLVVVNNWFVYMEACALIASNWARVYFVLFYMIAVQFMMNIFIAFFVESLDARFKMEAADEENKKLGREAERKRKQREKHDEMDGDSTRELRQARDRLLSRTVSRANSGSVARRKTVEKKSMQMAAVTAMDMMLNLGAPAKKDVAMGARDKADVDVGDLVGGMGKKSASTLGEPPGAPGRSNDRGVPLTSRARPSLTPRPSVAPSAGGGLSPRGGAAAGAAGSASAAPAPAPTSPTAGGDVRTFGLLSASPKASDSPLANLGETRLFSVGSHPDLDPPARVGSVASNDPTGKTVSRPKRLYIPVNRYMRNQLGVRRRKNFIHLNLAIFRDELAELDDDTVAGIIDASRVDWDPFEAHNKDGSV